MEMNEKEQQIQEDKQKLKIGPSKRIIEQYICTGCQFHYDRGITMGNKTMHQYFCQHLEKLEFTTGKAIGTSELTPEWCPELKEDN